MELGTTGEHVEDLKGLIQDFFARFRRSVTRESASELVTTCIAEKHSVEDLVFLLTELVDTRYGWYSTRTQSEGGGRVRDISIHGEGLSIQSWDGEEYQYSYEKGYRWRTPQGWISRDRLEDALGVWPGYIDAVEDLFRTVAKHIRQLREEKEQVKREFEERWSQAYEQLQHRMALDRHPTLRIWRERSRRGDDVPDCLRSVRHVRRMQAMEPCYVYFLLHEEQVVYVGQTTAPWPARIQQHMKEGSKRFDDVWYLEVDRPSLNQAERAFIGRFQPVYNRTRLTEHNEAEPFTEPSTNTAEM